MAGKFKFIWPILAVAATISLLLWSHREQATPAASWENVQQEARQGGYSLITTEELRERYEKGLSGLTLVDTRQDWEFRVGHIKGAVNFPMEPTRWARWRSRSAMAELLGPDKERPVVFY